MQREEVRITANQLAVAERTKWLLHDAIKVSTHLTARVSTALLTGLPRGRVGLHGLGEALRTGQGGFPGDSWAG